MRSYSPSDWYWQIADAEIYSSAARKIIEADDADYVAWLADGNAPTKINSMEDLVEVLRAANVPPYHLVPTRLIVDRLQAAGKLNAANAALEQSDLYTQQRWRTREKIYADDPTAIALLEAIGVVPSEILASE